VRSKFRRVFLGGVCSLLSAASLAESTSELISYVLDPDGGCVDYVVPKNAKFGPYADEEEDLRVIWNCESKFSRYKFGNICGPYIDGIERIELIDTGTKQVVLVQEKPNIDLYEDPVGCDESPSASLEVSDHNLFIIQREEGEWVYESTEILDKDALEAFKASAIATNFALTVELESLLDGVCVGFAIGSTYFSQIECDTETVGASARIYSDDVVGVSTSDCSPKKELKMRPSVIKISGQELELNAVPITDDQFHRWKDENYSDDDDIEVFESLMDEDPLESGLIPDSEMSLEVDGVSVPNIHERIKSAGNFSYTQDPLVTKPSHYLFVEGVSGYVEYSLTITEEFQFEKLRWEATDYLVNGDVVGSIVTVSYDGKDFEMTHGRGVDSQSVYFDKVS